MTVGAPSPPPTSISNVFVRDLTAATTTLASVTTGGQLSNANASGLIFSPDSRSVATESGDGVVRVWDVATGAPRTPPMAQSAGMGGLAFDGGGDVTRGRCACVLGRSGSRFPTRGEALLLHLFDQHAQCPLDNGRHVSVGDSVAEQILRLAQQVMTGATRRELELEGVLRERCNSATPFIASRRWRGRRYQRESRRRRGRRYRVGSPE